MTGAQLLGEEAANEDRAEREAEAERSLKRLQRKMRKAGLMGTGKIVNPNGPTPGLLRKRKGKR